MAKSSLPIERVLNTLKRYGGAYLSTEQISEKSRVSYKTAKRLLWSLEVKNFVKSGSFDSWTLV